MSGGPDFSLENFNTDDVEVLIGGQARPGDRGRPHPSDDTARSAVDGLAARLGL
jgi:hypothetical protein